MPQAAYIHSGEKTNLNGLVGRADDFDTVGVAERPVCFVLLAIFTRLFRHKIYKLIKLNWFIILFQH